jgi:hypothetical protein
MRIWMLAFLDFRTNPIDSYIDLIEPEDPDVAKLAKQFKSYEAAYRIVADEIKFVPFVPCGPVSATLKHGVGSCIGTAALLCSLNRATGLPQEAAWIDLGKDG